MHAEYLRIIPLDVLHTLCTLCVAYGYWDGLGHDPLTKAAVEARLLVYADTPEQSVGTFRS